MKNKKMIVHFIDIIAWFFLFEEKKKGTGTLSRSRSRRLRLWR